jgi:parvulin-like peptidyl-prolyl isomerase
MKLVYSGGEISPEEVIKYMTLSGQSFPIVTQVIKNREMIKKAKEMNIEVSDEQLQKFSDDFRAARELYTEEETLNFLKYHGLSEDDFEEFCELSILTSMLRDRVANESKIQEYYLNNRSDFDYARVSQIIVEKESLANEIAMQVTDEDEDFHRLARQFSLDEETKFAGGYIGLMNRRMLPPDISAKVFGAASGELLGPFPIENHYLLILVEEIIRSDLTDELKEEIKNGILEEWASEYLKGGIQITP